MNNKIPTLLSYAFRPFFLFNAIFAILVILAWTLTFHGTGLPGLTPLWHGHEMLVGFAMATVAGFSLTAVAVWTGRPALHGAPLAWLVFCWLAGRLAMAFSYWIPATLVDSIDMLFPLLLCALLAREVIAAGNRRNYVLVVITALMAVLNAVYHLGVYGLFENGQRISIYLLIHLMLVLVTLIAGRIVPSFTGNWLRMHGHEKMPVSSLRVDIVVLALTVSVGLAATLTPVEPATGILAFAAAIAHAFRLSRWRGMATRSNPLLFVLHATYAWLPIGYFLVGCSVFNFLITPTAALHALTMGAIGSMVLAVTTRVSLGHTGRPLQAARATVVAYWVMMIAIVIRVLGPLTGINYRLIIDLSAIGWMIAFALFVWVYLPILSRPKPPPQP
jgi:uncharacterized protein involved in response to NO